MSGQVAWDFIQSDIENFQGWKLYNLPGNLFHCWAVLMGEKASPYTQSEPILFYHKPVVSHLAPHHPHASHLQVEQVPLSWPLLTGQVLQHLTIMVALQNLLQFVNDSLVLGSQNWLLYLDVV